MIEVVLPEGAFPARFKNEDIHPHQVAEHQKPESLFIERTQIVNDDFRRLICLKGQIQQILSAQNDLVADEVFLLLPVFKPSVSLSQGKCIIQSPQIDFVHLRISEHHQKVSGDVIKIDGGDLFFDLRENIKPWLKQKIAVNNQGRIVRRIFDGPAEIIVFGFIVRPFKPSEDRLKRAVAAADAVGLP